MFKLVKINILKNMPVKIWSPWKHQVTWTVTCHIKFVPRQVLEKVAEFGSVCFHIKKKKSY